MTSDDNDLSNIYEEAQKFLSVSLRRWKAQIPEIYEDGFQEGMIQVWRDVEAGIDGGDTTKLLILRRARMAAEKFFHRNGEYYFGRARKSRERISPQSGTLEKVKIYLDEVMPVRDTWPTPKEVGEALGVPAHRVQKPLKDIREGRVDHMKYRPDGRMDWNYYKTHSVESLNPGVADTASTRHWSDAPEFFGLQTGFENDLVTNLDLTATLNKLAPGPREVLYQFLYQQYNRNDIGRHRHHEATDNIAAKGDRLLKAALNQVRMLLDPYEGSCQAGHKRTPENCRVDKREDGYYFRVCLNCRVRAAKVTNAKQRETKFKTGRTPKPFCPQGHPKTEGRCKICRAAAQKRYTEKRKLKGQE